MNRLIYYWLSKAATIEDGKHRRGGKHRGGQWSQKQRAKRRALNKIAHKSRVASK